MPTVQMTSHLYRFFPQLAEQTVWVAPGSAADVIYAVDELAPGFSDYILDERGALRRHVNLSINQTMVIDRQNLTDQVGDDDTLFIFQALTGG